MEHARDEGALAIGTLARRTGLAVSAIRYYEEIGLIPPALRRPSGHRAYPHEVQAVLTLVRHCRDLGFSLEQTRALVALSSSQERDCNDARAIAQEHLDAVRAKLSQLRELELSLAAFVNDCSTQCAGGPAPRCTILQDLATGARCCG